MASQPDNSWLQWLKIKLGLRDNEYDTATPGPERPMTGVLTQIMKEKHVDLPWGKEAAFSGIMLGGDETLVINFTLDPSLADDTMLVQTGKETAIFKHGNKVLSKIERSSS